MISNNLHFHGERGLAEISRYLHASSQITEATVKTWIFDGRIVGMKIRWTAIEPGKALVFVYNFNLWTNFASNDAFVDLFDSVRSKINYLGPFFFHLKLTFGR